MIKYAWAKHDGKHALPLPDHGTDVACCMRAILENRQFHDRLQWAAGRDLDPADLDLLVALAYLHDLGKANVGFWRRQFPTGDPLREETAGHTGVVAGACVAETPLRPQTRSKLIGIMEAAGIPLFSAMLAHHGAPLSEFHDPGTDHTHHDEGKLSCHRRLWKASEDYDPDAALSLLLDHGRGFLASMTGARPSLSEAPRFVSLFAGLLTLADWIGSDAERFPIGRHHDLARSPMARLRAAGAMRALDLDPLDREAFAVACRTFEDAFGFAPYEAQARASDPDLGAIAILEAETGSGKTEAAVWRFLHLAAEGRVDALYFALPTRTAAVQLHGRVNALLRHALGPDAPRAVLAVPGYIRAGDEDGRHLAPYQVEWPGEDGGSGRKGRWAAEAPKRFLSARIAVGTVDQVLMSGLQIKHAHLRAAALSRALLVVDEVHASDVYMTEVLKRVLANHTGVGGHAMLLSATLGASARAGILCREIPGLRDAIRTPYPALSGLDREPEVVTASRQEKGVSVRCVGQIGSACRIASVAVEKARAGASVLVVRNTVADAVATVEAVEALDPSLCFAVAAEPTLHHGRFAPEDRRLLDAEVEAVFGRIGTDQPDDHRRGRERRPVVLIGTQTLEQSLDIDADLLITDLCPMDVLLQRIGRLHRHPERLRPEGFAAAEVIVLVPSDRDLRPLATGARHGLGRLRSGGGVYPDLRVIEATWRALERLPGRRITVPKDCRRLVERATHPDALASAARRACLTDQTVVMEGRAMSDRQLARSHGLDMSVPFRSLLFPSDEAVRTRLGLDDRLVDLPAPTRGPFGRFVARLRIPGWMADGIGDGVDVSVDAADGVLKVRAGEASYRYDRFGLRRED